MTALHDAEKRFHPRAVPEVLLRPLLQGCTGTLQLHTLADTALNLAAQGNFFPAAELARDFFLCAWEESPLDLNCVKPLLEFHECRPCLPEALARLLKEIQRSQRVPADTAPLRAFVAARDDEGLAAYIRERCAAEPDNSWWVQQAVRFGQARDLGLIEECLARAVLPVPVREMLLADAALLAGDHASAVRRYTASLRVLPLPGRRARLGESLLRAGQEDEALRHLEAASAVWPWHTEFFLRCDDLRRGRHKAAAALSSARRVILLYTWNKAALLDATLASLHASEIGDAEIIVLDNGSSDETPALLQTWTERFGPRFGSLRLPCNIGAPAARNWLLCLPQLRNFEQIVFLDDDILLPPDWLRFFETALAAYPNHGVFGCRVVERDRPHLIQCADFHLAPGDDPNKRPGPLPDYVQRFAVSVLHIQAAQDFGRFSYLRPCASVTGCCHLFRREALFATGLFDIRYSPSQFDDFEHDLRHVLRGDMPVYQGWLRIRHARQTGSYGGGDDPQLAGSWANMYKLQMRYTREQFDAIRAAEHEALLADTLGRLGEKPDAPPD
jgi:glycosyltransferase involved in cell wall biosynthesis